MTLINGKTECYLTEAAQEAVDEMVRDLKMDRDLAIAVLEALCEEQAIYELPEA